MKSKILIFGVSGLLGSKLFELARKKYEVYGTFNNNNPSFDNVFKIDVRNRESVHNIVKQIKPDLVVDAHSLTNVDYCELNPEEAWSVNVYGTKNIVEACKMFGCKIVYISTDYVFDGKKEEYSENDEPKPINFYGITKVLGEKLVEIFDLDYIILRTSVLYGVGGFGKKPFPLWVLENLKSRREIKVAIDQYNNPTYVQDLAEVIITLYEKRLNGLYHAVGKDNVSRFEFAIKTAEIFNLDSSLIKRGLSVELNQPAPRPKKLKLSTDKIKKILGRELSGIEEGLKRMKKEMEEKGLI